MRRIIVIFLLMSFSATAQHQNDSIYLARTTSRLAMLAYGPGDESNTKLGYLDTSVLLRVIDSSKEMYRVQLSKAHNAYINKSDIVKDPATVVRPYYLTSSFSIKGDDSYDYINIPIDEKLPYKSWVDINPARIFLDIYGVQSNTNWISQLRSAREIKDVYFNQTEDDVVRVTIDLQHKQHWGYSVFYNNKILCVRIRRQPRSLKVNKLFIALDAGHGGSNEGAVGIKGKGAEKIYTLRFTNELEKYLKKKGITTLMTRNSDTTINSYDRILMLQNTMPDLLISLHFNSSANADVKGVSTYYKQISYKALSAALLNRLLQLDLAEFGNVGNFGYTLNAPTDFPNALIEIAFLSNAEDEQKIVDPRFQKSVAKKIYKGVKDWLKTAKE